MAWKRLINDGEDLEKPSRFWLFLGIFMLCMLVVGMVAMGVHIALNGAKIVPKPKPCPDIVGLNCGFTMVESIPENLTYPAEAPSHPSTFSRIQEIVRAATSTIEIASYYWTMNPYDLNVTDPSDWQGQQLFQDLVSAGKDRGIEIRIVQNYQKDPVKDTLYLAANAGAKVRSLDLARLQGSGIIHTKMWLVDRKHFYVGSANLDWRSFTQVKEMGAVVTNCSCLAQDIGKIFDAYWYMATPSSSFPPVWPAEYDTVYNNATPMPLHFNGYKYHTYLSSSPPRMCPSGRSQDGATIVNIIGNAKKFVYIAVMDYFPTTQFSHPRKYWPVIDDALRSAAFDRHIEVRLLASYWNNTWEEMFVYLKSLQALKFQNRYANINVNVKLFVVPAYTEAQRRIPFSRVNHNKYMVTDNTAYIGTSNWSGDYFTSTAGIGLVVTADNPNLFDVRQQLQDVFERDWNSQYAFDLSHFNQTSIF